MGLIVTSTPPEKPTISGPNQGLYNQTLTFSAVTTDPNGEQIYYLFDWGNGEVSDWLGPFNSGEVVEASYSWPGIGAYIVKVKAKDVNNANSEWSNPHRVDILDNTKPENPLIDGPKSGKVGEICQYTISAIDIDNQDVCFQIIWGDGKFTTWSDFYTSGEEVIFDHKFNKSGIFTIQVQAMDTFGYKSSWTIFEVSMPRFKTFKNFYFK